MLDLLKQQLILFMNSKITTVIAAFAGLFFAAAANAQDNKAQGNSVKMDNGVVVTNAKISRSAAGVNVQMDLDFRAVKVGWDREVQVIPALAGAKDTLNLAQLTVLGRNRYFYHLRNQVGNKLGIQTTVSDKDMTWRKQDVPDSCHFDITVPYAAWMNGARIMVNECLLGCCSKVLDDDWKGTDVAYQLPVVPDFAPTFVYLRPKAEVVKMRALSAVSYVDFPVSQTAIYPEYRNNPRELAKIVSTVDSVRNDKDIIIRSINLKGYASPESPYENNYRLAKGRTASIKKYLSSFSHIPMDVIDTDFEPENWQGLRDFVEASDLENKKGIIAIIDSHEIGPDPREDYLKRKYPEEYKYLHEVCYPALRKVDYEIQYEIKVFTDIQEIRRVFAESPSKLSLDEFYVLALSYPEDSAEFHNVIREAVKYYPKDAAANLNAANIAMMEGRIGEAGRYLDKAGDSPEASYARGVYNALIKDYDRSADYFAQAKAEIPAAKEAYDQVQNIKEIKSLLFEE